MSKSVPHTRAQGDGPVDQEQVLRWMGQAHEHFAAFEFGAGHAALARTLALDPEFLPAHWARFQLPDDLAHTDATSMKAFRKRWRAGVEQFAAIDWAQPKRRAQIWGCVGQCTAFYRHYLGDDVTGEQRAYGALVSRMMRELAGPAQLAGPPARPRRRIVFVSAYTYEHTVTRLFGSLIVSLDPARFESHLLQIDPSADAHTASLVAGVAHAHPGPRDARAWCDLIRALAPDVIVYSDVGMHPLPQCLAALRLAPLQAVLWGHPVTTGLPTIDCFLSSEWFEPHDGQEHYSERLVRLPGLGAGLAAPASVALPPRSWPSSGGTDYVEVLCAQSFFKMLPAQIDALVSILGQSPKARLHLTPHGNAQVRGALEARLRERLQDAGVPHEHRLVLHPMLPLGEFRGLASRCDLGLDTLGWSGGMSALDQLGEGLPVVSLRGAPMRSRQTSALLEQLEVPELIARDLDQYVSVATSLVGDPARRATLRRHILARRDRLYNTAPVHRAFADFLACAPLRPGL